MIDREKMAEDFKLQSGRKNHTSDCSTSIAPARIPGPCDCEPFDDEKFVAENFCPEIHPKGEGKSPRVYGCLGKPDHVGQHYCEGLGHWGENIGDIKAVNDLVN